jgi:GH35 family endo-1,4-beta-xylanase
MYINETGIVGQPANRKVRDFKLVLDYMTQNGVDFDGIGIQGHFGAFVSPKVFYDELMEIAAYGKEMKITEYDCSFYMNTSDPEAEASFTRDIMILSYSIEQMDGFLMWGFWDKSHWLKNAPIFEEDWTLKESGKQYLDLVYNKWWTQENGKTAADGTFGVKGYYGDYLITATANGKSKTVDIKHYKGKTNTIEIVLD